MLPNQEEIKSNIVFVIDKNKKPLLPTCSARGRLLLKKNKAKLISVVPFTIQLNYEVKNIVGEFKVGIDDGAKEAGIAVVNEFKNEVVFIGTIRLRQDVSRKILQKSMYRKNRRNRKLRYRPERFLNRKQAIPFPSIKCRKDTINRVLNDLEKRLNIINSIVEQGQFDASSIVKGRKLEGREYQTSDFKGKNRRAKVLWRDRYTCQKCKSTIKKLNTHHIIMRSKGGTDTIGNLITLCEDCHDDLHKEKFVLNIKPKLFQYPQYLQQGKWYLLDKLKEKYQEVKVCFGWQTSSWRRSLGLEKNHFNDAVSMVCKDKFPTFRCKDYLIIPKRKKVWENNPSKKCEEKNGFKHFDLVKSRRAEKIIIGSVSALKKNTITLRTKFDNNYAVRYGKTKLLYRPKNIVYI